MVKTLPAKAGDAGFIPGLGRSPGGGNGSPLQYSCQDNPMDRGAWWATVHGVTLAEQLSTHARTRIYMPSPIGRIIERTAVLRQMGNLDQEERDFCYSPIFIK